MADRTKRMGANVPGAYYVDDSCIDCDLCRVTAPRIFSRDAEGGTSRVHHQPSDDAERAEAEEARLGCPTESIGCDG